MQFFAPPFITLVVMYLSSGTAAICSGSTAVGIGSAANGTQTGYTQYNIYDASCNVKYTNVFATAAGVCDNQGFLCTPGTKTIAEYDDPTSGWAYTCTVDATVESCSSDAITYCCVPK